MGETAANERGAKGEETGKGENYNVNAGDDSLA